MQSGSLALLVLLWASMTVFVVLAYDPKYSTLIHNFHLNPALIEARDPSFSFSSHQGFSRSLIFTTLFFIALSSNPFARWSVFSLTSFALIILGSRSELFAFVFAVLIFEICSVSSIRYYLIKASFFALSASLLAYFFGSQISQVLVRSKLKTLANISSDGSFSARLAQFQTTIKQISQNPISGSFGEHLEKGGHGDLVHNIFAAWALLGLPGFVGISVLMVGSILCVIKARHLKNSFSPNVGFAFLIAVYATPQILITKSAFVEWLPMMFGATVAARVRGDDEWNVIAERQIRI